MQHYCVSCLFVLLRSRRFAVVRLLLLLLVLNVCFGLLFYWAESEGQPGLSPLDAFWWALVTMTTVGYGDISPLSWAGRFLVAYPAMFMGIGLVSWIIGSLSVLVIGFHQRQKMGMVKVKRKNHIVICNQPSVRKIANLAAEIRRERSRLPIVVLGEAWGEIPEELKLPGLHLVCADPGRRAGLERASVQQARAVFVLPRELEDPHSDHSSFITASLIRTLNAERAPKQKKIRCLVELVLRENLAFVQEADPDGIFVPQVFNENLMVQEFLKPGIAGLLGNLASTEGDQVFAMQHKLAGWSLKDIYLKLFERDSSIQLCGIHKADGSFDLAPRYSYVLQKRDRLLLVARDESVYLHFERAIAPKKRQDP